MDYCSFMQDGENCIRDLWLSQCPTVFPIKLILLNSTLHVDAITCVKSSKLFRDIFQIDPLTTSIKIDKEATACIVRSWYGFPIEINSLNMLIVLQTADYLGDVSTFDMCIQQIETRLKIDQVKQAWHIGLSLNSIELRVCCLEFLYLHSQPKWYFENRKEEFFSYAADFLLSTSSNVQQGFDSKTMDHFWEWAAIAPLCQYDLPQYDSPCISSA